MPLLDDLTKDLNYDCQVKDIRQGVFHTAVLTRRCGMAATLPKDALRQQGPMVAEPGFLLDKSPSELAKLVHSPRLLEAAMGMATINSLLPVDAGTMIERNAGDILLEKGAGKNVTVIGHFPFLPQLRQKAGTLWVLENNPQEGDLGPEKAPDVLPRSDVVAMTGTAITNHTFDDLIALCRPDAYVLLLGDSVPFSTVLFDYNVSALCGTVATDPETVLRCVSQGANYRQIRGVKRFTIFKD